VRAVDVRDKIQEAIEGIEPDHKAHAGDSFRLAPPTMDYPPQDRVFIITRTAPQAPAELLFAGADPYQITFDIAVTYLPTPAIQDRVLNDGDLIVDAVKLLESANAQILNTELQGAADFEDQSGNRLCTWSLRVIYDRRNAG
jgi:hypothetical protein